MLSVSSATCTDAHPYIILTDNTPKLTHKEISVCKVYRFIFLYYEYIDEAWSGGTWANVYFNALTKKGSRMLEDLVTPKSGIKMDKEQILTFQDGLFVPGNSEEAAMVVQKLIEKHKPNWRLNTATKQIYDKKTRSFVHPKGSEKVS